MQSLTGHKRRVRSLVPFICAGLLLVLGLMGCGDQAIIQTFEQDANINWVNLPSDRATYTSAGKGDKDGGKDGGNDGGGEEDE